MTGTVHTTGFAPELLYPGLAAIFGQTYSQIEKMYPQFMTIKRSTKRFEKEQGMTGFGLAGVKDEGDSIPYSRITQGFQKEYNHTTYANGAVITREMMEDDQYNVIQRIPSLLAQSLNRTEETIATNVINNGFDSSVTGADGLCLFNSSHVNAGSSGGTQSNTPLTATDLTEAALEQGFIDIGNFRDENNQRIRIRPTKLLVPYTSEFLARKILGTKQKVGTADNDINVISSMGLQLIVSNYITDLDSWYLITDAENGLTFYMRRDAEIQRDNDFDTENLKIKTSMRFDTGWTDWRGAYGCPGA